MSRKKSVLWSPHRDNSFLVGAADLRHWEWSLDANDEAPTISSVAHQSENLGLMRCFTWSFDPAQRDLVAVGTNSGRVTLLHLAGKDGPENRREFQPKQSRACNAVAFNPTFHNQLLAGMDKARSEPCLLIWDTNVQSIEDRPPSLSAPIPVQPVAGAGMHAASLRPLPKVEPIRGFATAEGAVSATWFHENPSLLAAGLSSKGIRLYDARCTPAFRVRPKPQLTRALRRQPREPPSTRAPPSLSAVCRLTRSAARASCRTRRTASSRCGTFASFRRRQARCARGALLAALSANAGRRCARRQLLSINTDTALVEVAWCPTRRGVIGSAARDEDFVRAWHVLESRASGDDSEVVLYRCHKCALCPRRVTATG